MAVPVKNIEREFLLQAALRERLPVTMKAGGGEWTTRIVSVDQRMIIFHHDLPLKLLKKGALYDFSYNLRGHSIAFRSAMLEPGEGRFGVALPEKVYKNLSRRFIRMPPPGDLSAFFSFAGERYDLDFPSSATFNPAREPEPSPDFRSSDLRGLTADFKRKAEAIADVYGIVMFKDRKPHSLEERLVATSGKCFFMPLAALGVPASDPFADRTILTRDDFLEYFSETKSLEPDFAEHELKRFERARQASGVVSELIVPVVFQNFTIGYATIINKDPARRPFDPGDVETFLAFARYFSWSLKLHGYFKDAPKLDQNYQTQVVDVSAGGLLFACTEPRLVRALKEGSTVSVRLRARGRPVDIAGTIRRHYDGDGEAYVGIEFNAMAPEDFRFLFEYLYGRAFSDQDADSVEGARLASP